MPVSDPIEMQMFFREREIEKTRKKEKERRLSTTYKLLDGRYGSSEVKYGEGPALLASIRSGIGPT